MADSIGSETFIRLDGDVIPKGQSLKSLTREGADGVAFARMGIRGEPFELTGIRDYTTAANADAAHDTYRALKGSMVTITINGVARATYLVLDVRSIRLPVVANPVGGIVGGAYLVQSSWQFIYGGL